VGERGFRLLSSAHPKIVIRFPKKGSVGEVKEKAKKAMKAVSDDDGWLVAKSKGVKRKAAVVKATKKGKKAATTRKKSKAPAKAKTRATKTSKKAQVTSEVIELSSDEETVDPTSVGRDGNDVAAENDDLWHDDSESDGSASEFEFE
jgi:hypothetical protein